MSVKSINRRRFKQQWDDAQVEIGVGSAAKIRDSPAAAALELHEVSKRFGRTEIIRGVSLRIPRGERHGIIGPNGAGKSTLFSQSAAASK